MLDYVCRPIGVIHYHGHVCSQGLVIELLGPKWVDSSWEQDDSSRWIIILRLGVFRGRDEFWGRILSDSLNSLIFSENVCSEPLRNMRCCLHWEDTSLGITIRRPVAFSYVHNSLA